MFGLSWTAQRYKMGQDPDAWERLAPRYGEPDDPLIRHARAAVYQDWAVVGRWAAAAMAGLRRDGEGDLAEQIELDGAAPLVFAGRYRAGRRADRPAGRPVPRPGAADAAAPVADAARLLRVAPGRPGQGRAVVRRGRCRRGPRGHPVPQQVRHRPDRVPPGRAVPRLPELGSHIDGLLAANIGDLRDLREFVDMMGRGPLSKPRRCWAVWTGRPPTGPGWSWRRAQIAPARPPGGLDQGSEAISTTTRRWSTCGGCYASSRTTAPAAPAATPAFLEDAETLG